MNKKRKICVITGTRAEYGLLYWVMKGIQDSSELELQLIATGMHLSPEFGNTYKQIEQDGFVMDKKIELLLSSDSNTGISKSVGLGVISFSEALQDLSPDMILVLGDRFEIFAACTAAMIAKIPIAHCHGGERTEGQIDEPIRHSITKMSHIHFTATEEYRKRVIQLGERPENVFFVGGLGVEWINRVNLLSRQELQKALDFELGDPFALVTFHPVTLEENSAEYQFNQLLLALEDFPDLKVVFTMPNADTDGRIIIKQIKEFVSGNASRTRSFISLGQLKYLSCLKHASIVIGNSSSGIIEAPSFKVPVVNIGDRQRGRIMADSVINCEPEKEAIVRAIKRGILDEFRGQIMDVQNPYGNGNASEKIIPVLENILLSDIVKKQFFDIQFDI